MTIEVAIGLAITISTAILGFLGWSHKNLKKGMDHMEIELYRRASFSDVRRIIEDKMSPVKVEYTSLARRMDELKTEHHKLNDKIDELLVICTKLAHVEK